MHKIQNISYAYVIKRECLGLSCCLLGDATRYIWSKKEYLQAERVWWRCGEARDTSIIITQRLVMHGAKHLPAGPKSPHD